MGDVELEAEICRAALNVVVETHVKDVGDDEADEEVGDGVDEALAELGEMLHQAHAGEFGAFGYGLACPVDRVEISHAEWPRLVAASAAAVAGSGSWGMESRTGERAELLTGRPVDGGMRLRSPEVAMGSGSWLDAMRRMIRDHGDSTLGLLVRVAYEELFGGGGRWCSRCRR